MLVKDMFPERDSHRKVAMPERLSDTTGIWHGRLREILEEHGIRPARQGKDGPIKAQKWTKYTVITQDDVAFTTFSSTDALLARCALAGDMRVEVQWERDAYDGKSILVIDEAPAPEGEAR